MEKGVDDLPERDGRRLPERRRAVQDHEVDEPLPLELVDARLAVRNLEREQREGSRRGEAEPRSSLIDGSSPFEHGQQQLGTKSSLDIASSTGLDHVWHGDACCLGQSVLGLLVESVAVVDDPDRSDRLVRRPDRDGRPRLHIVDLGQAAREDPPQGRAVCAHHTRSRQHLAIERTHAPRIGNLAAENRAATGSVDRLVAERRIGEYAPCWILDRDGATDDPRNGVCECKEVTERNAGDAGGRARHRREAAQVEQRMEPCPRHLLRHREDGDAEGAATAHELVQIRRRLHHDGSCTRLRRSLDQLVAARRPEPDADGEHNRVARDRRKLGGVVDHRLANGHVEPERRNSHLNHVTTEVFEQRLERHRLIRRRRHRRVVVSIVRHDNGPRHARRLLLPPLSAMRL